MMAAAPVALIFEAEGVVDFTLEEVGLVDFTLGVAVAAGITLWEALVVAFNSEAAEAANCTFAVLEEAMFCLRTVSVCYTFKLASACFTLAAGTVVEFTIGAAAMAVPILMLEAAAAVLLFTLGARAILGAKTFAAPLFRVGRRARLAISCGGGGAG